MDCKVERERDESIKKYWDNIWLNPKYCKNGQSAAKLPTVQNDWKKVQRLWMLSPVECK